MKLRMATILTMFCLLSCLAGAVQAESGPSLFNRGVRAYEAGDYAHAAELFEQVAGTGVVNGELFYNAGNAWFKAGDLGRAVLWYKRAERLMPANPDLAYNLGRAEAQVRDQRPEQGYVEQGLRRWAGFWSPGVAAWIAVVVNVLFWGLLAARRAGRPAFLGTQAGPWVRGMRNALLAGTLVFGVTAGWWYCRAVCFPQGVVLAETLSARSGLGDLASKLFTVHAGTVVDIERSREHHVLIRHGADRVGWVPETDIGKI